MQKQATCEHVKDVRVAGANAVVHKTECCMCFDSDESEAGLNVCLTCYTGGCTGPDGHSQRHFTVTKHPIVVNIKKREVPKAEPEGEEPPTKVQKLAIGVPGGVDDDQPTYEYDTKVLCLACNCELDRNHEGVSAAVDSVMAAEAAAVQKESSWEDKATPCEHTLMLQQVENPPQLQHKSLSHCQSCDLKEGLWLCMTCGALGCGRKNYDGSGGNGHALEHHKATGHLLVLKAGTITPEGEADIHCYGCDRMVVDESLGSHLQHFGIDMGSQEKTVKSMAELNLELNLKHDWSRVLEQDGKEAKLLYGPGHCGLANLGNSCYMASTLQALYMLPSFQRRFVEQGRQHQAECRNGRPADCYECQLAKVGLALYSGKYSPEPTAEQRAAAQKAGEAKNKGGDDGDKSASLKRYRPLQPGVAPRMFKRLVARDHAEFRGVRQQDAAEFMSYFVDQIKQKLRNKPGEDPTTAFNFKLQTRGQCSECNKVAYKTTKTNQLALGIPAVEKPRKQEGIMEDDNGDGKDEKPAKPAKPAPVEYEPVSFQACLDSWAAPEAVDAYKCPQCNKATLLSRTTRFSSFPEVLVVPMRRFVYTNWVPSKLDAEVQVPEHIDLSQFLGKGLQPGEEQLPSTAAAAPAADDSIVQALMQMGFGKNRCMRAALATHNSGAEAASNWLFAHMDDASLDEPLEGAAAPAGAGAAAPVPPELVANLTAMGFPADRCEYALRQTSMDPGRAVDWLFSHADEPLPEAEPAAAGGQPKQEDEEAPGSPKYRLGGFVTHLGKSTGTGHYVAHLKRGEKWVQYNDAKVSEARNPPIGMGYIYFFLRQDE